MLPTIIFFFALVFTFAFVIMLAQIMSQYLVTKKSVKDYTASIYSFIASGLWTWLFYLLH